MTETKNAQKAVTLEAFQAASELIATKAEVQEVRAQIDELQTGGMEFATTEEVLALFAPKSTEDSEKS